MDAVRNFTPTTVQEFRKVLFGAPEASKDFLSSLHLIQFLFTAVGAYADVVDCGYRFGEEFVDYLNEVRVMMIEDGVKTPKALLDGVEDNIDEEEDDDDLPLSWLDYQARK